MKIICPGHLGAIEVPSQKVISALSTPLKCLVFYCPICQEEVLLKNLKSVQDGVYIEIKQAETPNGQKKEALVVM